MFPIQIISKDITISDGIEALIKKYSSKLTRFNKIITNCRVALEFCQKHKHQGKLYNVKIEVDVPKKELAVTRIQNQDLYIALRNAFHAIIRQLHEYSQKRHGQIKTHDSTIYGRIVRLIPTKGYGFIEGMDGNEYYFNLTNVSYPAFEKLSVGDTVSYIASSFEMGDGKKANRITKEKSALE